MSNRIFDSLVKEKIENFYNAYTKVSRQVFFYDEKLIHPGEYGRYREKICSDLLKLFIPNRISIGDGFIITNQDNVSSQCDLVLFDNLLTPQIQTNEMQTFYTIESVVGVIEVKSALKLCDLREALIKLAKIKDLRNKINSPVIKLRLGSFDNKIFDAKINPQDSIFTALICEKFDFNKAKMEDIINEIYPDDIPSYNKHNLIMSLEDGLILYSLSECTELVTKISSPLDKTLNGDPVFNGHSLKCSYLWADDRKSHIATFLNYFVRTIQNITVMSPEIMHYVSGFNKVDFK